MAYKPNQLRLERVRLECAHHSAYLYWSLRGVIAERWGHGPVFGAFSDGNQSTTLLPSPSEDVRSPLQGVYGLKATGLNAEQVGDLPEVERLASQWFEDVYEVLKPKRTTGIRAECFGLYPVRNPHSASTRLRDRFYKDDDLGKIIPENFERPYWAVNSLAEDGEITRSLIVGVVGPPHKGEHFVVANPQRDDKWWMGIKVAYTRVNESGILDPTVALLDLHQTTKDDFYRVAGTVLPSIAD